MNIDDVKLQPEDLRGIKVVFKHVYEAPIEDIAKAAQLKLLEWLKEECKGHDYKYNYQEGTYTEVLLGSLVFNGEDNVPAQMTRHMKFTLRQDCSWCISELESKLKEAR